MHSFNILQTFWPKKFIGVITIIVSVINGQSQVFPVDTLVRNGERSNRINFVYLSDGYVSADLPTFINNAATINNAMFSQTPFLEYNKYFNCYAIKVPSAESGAKHPGTAIDESSSGGQPVENPNNYFQSTFDFFSIHRLLAPQNTTSAFNILASNIPDYDQPFVVVNSLYYGGSGGVFAAASSDPSSAEVAIHEIGHSFANLADEYWAGDMYAAERPNMTHDNSPGTIKWKNWLGINGIGIYPHAESPTWYRPHENCKMRFLNNSFCSVCTERFIDRIHQLINMIDMNSPSATSFTLVNTNDVDFSVTTVQTIPSTITTNWYLNGSTTPFAINQDNITIPFTSFNNGNNTIRAEVIDNSILSKSYLPAVGYINTLTWTVNNPSALPISLKSFSGKVNQFTGFINWQIDNSADLQKFELEKSRDGNNFSAIATINGQAGKKNYEFSDPDLLNPFTYYRLKIIDNSGEAIYSNILRLQNAFDKLFYKVYQDADNHKYHIKIGLEGAEKISINIVDLNGKRILNKDFGLTKTGLDYDMTLAEKPAGIYFLRIGIGNRNYTTQLLAK